MTWSCFVEQLLGDPDLVDWDVFSLGFPSRLSLDLPLWKGDPGIVLCARSMATKLRSSTLSGYASIAVVAHSMGGLVSQRAVLDTDLLDRRLSHLMLFGTPSAGLVKAGMVRLLKLQLNDMARDGAFVTRLRGDWNERIGPHPSFAFKTIAGESDLFVPHESSLDPFAVPHQEVVPGNHLEIVRPRSRSDQSYDLFKRILRGGAAPHSVTQTARLAVERGEFRRAIKLLEPGFKGLDGDAVVTLALALDSEGRDARALQVLEEWGGDHRHTDLRGTLAGRLKRRWLLTRQSRDFERALDLYRASLADAVVAGASAQAFYHAINVAFLLIAATRDDEPVPPGALEAAVTAEQHCLLAPPSPWREATLGEAKLVQGDLEGAVGDYEAASKAASTVRDRNSMYSQASALAARIHGAAGRERIDRAFGIIAPAS